MSRGNVSTLTLLYREAEEAFGKAMKLEPKMFEAADWYRMGLQAERQFEYAAGMFERASTLPPEDYQAAHLLGHAYQSPGRKEDEETNLRTGLKPDEGEAAS